MLHADLCVFGADCTGAITDGTASGICTSPYVFASTASPAGAPVGSLQVCIPLCMLTKAPVMNSNLQIFQKAQPMKLQLLAILSAQIFTTDKGQHSISCLHRHTAILLWHAACSSVLTSHLLHCLPLLASSSQNMLWLQFHEASLKSVDSLQ